MTPEEARATVRQHVQKLSKDRSCGSEDILTDRQTDTQTQTDRHTHRRTYHNTSQPLRWRSKNYRNGEKSK